MDGIGESTDALFKVCGCLVVLFVPLGTWKMIEIIIWIWRNVSIAVGS